MNTIFLKNDSDTSKLGSLIASEIAKIDQESIEIHLEGDLGAGKTFLTKSIIVNSGWNGHVKSPTYTLCEEYDLGELIFLHIDLYRTKESEDIQIFDLDRKTHLKKIIIIEWPQKLTSKRDFDLKINLEHSDEGRKVTILQHDKIFLNLVNNYE